MSSVSMMVMAPILLFSLVFLITSIHSSPPETGEYTNDFAIYVDPEQHSDEIAKQVAQRYGFVFQGKIGSLDGHYLLKHHHVAKRSTDYSHQHHQMLKEDPYVLWVEQQQVKIRRKRDNDPQFMMINEDEVSNHFRTSMKDPLFPEQWYINKGARGGYDMNVAGAWARGYTGKKVVVTILDDGIQPDHPDLQLNYDPDASFDVNDNDSDPTPQDNNDNKHGTRCAGEVAAEAFNEFCGVGIAYNASIGGVRMLDGMVTDQVEAKALSLNPNHVHIYSASWGPEDDGKTVDGPGRLAQRAFLNGIRMGRNGRGSIFVWASGNGGRRFDNCNCDGYTNSIYTLSISSAAQNGERPWYNEQCSSTLSATYSSGTVGIDQSIVTVDLDNSYKQSVMRGEAPVTSNLCTLSHTGTSASAPIAAAICALALEANPNLTWRDMQHLVIGTSRYQPLRFEDGWATNGVGRKYNHMFGFGLMDAEAMVVLAEKWESVPKQHICDTEADVNEYEIPADGKSIEVTMRADGCQGGINHVRYLEHVQARITLMFKPRGNIHISLISPSGTRSVLLFPRWKDTEESSFNDWPFLSVHFWGENPLGIWKLIISNYDSPTKTPGLLSKWSLSFYGTFENPMTFRNPHNITTFHNLPRRTNIGTRLPQIENECFKSGLFKDSVTHECVSKCPSGSYAERDLGSCILCHPSCGDACYGPGPDHCLTCNKGKFYYGDRCVSICPDTHYNHESLSECLPCAYNCKACHSSPTRCKYCKPNYMLNTASECVPSPCIPKDGKDEAAGGGGGTGCPITSCPSPQKLFSGGCISHDCPLGYYESVLSSSGSSSCDKCHPSCQSCLGPSHKECIECSGNYTSMGGICSKCRPGQFLNRALELPVCQQCHSSCSECKGPGEESCTRCESPLHLYGNQCVYCCGTQPGQLLEVETNNSIPQSTGQGEGPDVKGKSNSTESPICCRCINGIGPCVQQEHIRSVYGSEYENLEQPSFLRQDDGSFTWFRNHHVKSSSPKYLFLFAFTVVVCITLLVIGVRKKFVFRTRNLHSFTGSSHSVLPKKSWISPYPMNQYERISMTDDVNSDEEDVMFEQKT